MAVQNANSEPSMEEILASIRRIISEDDDTARKPAEPPLELTKPVAEAPPAPPPPSVPDDDLMVFEDEAPPPPPREEPRPEPPRATAPIPAPPPQPAIVSEDALISEPAVAAAANSFTRLAGSLRLTDAPGQTLESVVRELLRPMMKQWLDENLPRIVEAKVEAELERISRMTR